MPKNIVPAANMDAPIMLPLTTPLTPYAHRGNAATSKPIDANASRLLFCLNLFTE